MLCGSFEVFVFSVSRRLPRRFEATSAYRVFRASFKYPHFCWLINGVEVVVRHVCEEVDSTGDNLEGRPHFFDVFCKEGGVAGFVRAAGGADGVRSLHVFCPVRRPACVD